MAERRRGCACSGVYESRCAAAQHSSAQLSTAEQPLERSSSTLHTATTRTRRHGRTSCPHSSSSDSRRAAAQSQPVQHSALATAVKARARTPRSERQAHRTAHDSSQQLHGTERAASRRLLRLHRRLLDRLLAHTAHSSTPSQRIARRSDAAVPHTPHACSPLCRACMLRRGQSLGRLAALSPLLRLDG